MRPIEGYPITRTDEGYKFTCKGCGKEHFRSTKSSAIKTLNRGSCKSCLKSYITLNSLKDLSSLNVYLNASGKWCSNCSSCGIEQPYTRKEHAKQSAVGNWLCKSCANYKSKTRPSIHRGFKLVEFDKIQRSAVSRGLAFSVDIDDLIDLFESQNSKCALSGVELIREPKNWSIDRINPKKDYHLDNVQFVHNSINFMKGAFNQEEFITACHYVSENKPNPNIFPSGGPGNKGTLKNNN